jgi:hypothetical protein
MSTPGIIIRQKPGTSINVLADQVGEPLEPKLCGQPAWLTRIASDGDWLCLFKAPPTDGARTWLERCSRDLAPGINFYVAFYNPDAWQWTGPGVERAREEGVDLRTLPPPVLPDLWREYFATPHFAAA